jgi:hypothetical protein
MVLRPVGAQQQYDFARPGGLFRLPLMAAYRFDLKQRVLDKALD